MEFISAKGGELFDKIKNKPLTEPQARRVMKQLLEAMEVKIINITNTNTK